MVAAVEARGGAIGDAAVPERVVYEALLAGRQDVAVALILAWQDARALPVSLVVDPWRESYLHLACRLGMRSVVEVLAFLMIMEMMMMIFDVMMMEMMKMVMEMMMMRMEMMNEKRSWR